MLSSLVPGFRGRGSPSKQLASEERARERRAWDDNDEAWRRLEEHPAVEEVRDADPGRVPDATGEGAVRGGPRIRRRYTPTEEAQMESIRSPRYRGDDPEHHQGVHPWAGLGTIAPAIGNPNLAPTD